MIAASQNGNFDVAISWIELPPYGARLIRAGIQNLKQPVAVISTRPPKPSDGVEELLGQKVIWVDESGVRSWADLGLPAPKIFFQAGWYLRSFNRLGEQMRKEIGGQVVCLVDNCWRNTPRQWLGAIKFRLVYRRWFSAMWVPGESGVMLQRFYGVPRKRIYKGLYGADPECFIPGPPLSQRPKRIIFVGRFVPLKNLSTVVEAFEKFRRDFPEWELWAYGAGECADLLSNRPGVLVHPFAPPPQIAEAMQNARFLVLASWSDHWPLVVAEASLVGCGLILSDRIGNRQEFLTARNGFVFPWNSSRALADRFRQAASMSDLQADQAYEDSKRMGSAFGPNQWADMFRGIITDLRPDALQ